MQISKKEKIMLFVMLIVFIVVLLYMYVIKPDKESIATLSAEKSNLETESTGIMDKVLSLSSMNSSMTQLKGKAMDLNTKYVSGDSTIYFMSKIETTVKAYVNIDETQGGKTWSPITTNMSITPAGSETATIVNQCSVTFSYTAKPGTDGATSLRNLLIDLRDNYPYIIVSGYSFIPAAGNNPANGEISLMIIVIPTALNSYSVGICPCEQADGTPCEFYVEFDTSTCARCKNAIDNCPNCNEMLKYDEAATTVTCDNCETILGKCTHCNQYMVEGDTFCTKCNSAN